MVPRGIVDNNFNIGLSSGLALNEREAIRFVVIRHNDVNGVVP